MTTVTTETAEGERAAARTRQVRLVAWSATSAYGSGRGAHAEGVTQRRDVVAKVDRDTWDVAADYACLVPDFDVRAVLGKKGTRTMNRVTGLSVATVGSLIGELGGTVAPETGLVLGTTHGSAQSSMEFTRGSLAAAAPFHVESGIIPYAVMNGAAGQCAIWHGLKGPNATLAAGRASHLLAMNYARRLLLAGRATTILCGAAEEFSEARYWLSRATFAGADPVSDLVLGEGCGMVALTTDPATPDGPQTLASLLATSVVCVPGDGSAGTADEVVGGCVESALRRAGVAAADVWSVSVSGGDGVLADAERAVASHRFPDAAVVADTAALGRLDSATAAFQLAGALTRAAAEPAARGRHLLITCVDDNGAVCATVLRVGS